MTDEFKELRAREFGRLDAGGHVYLDYTGSGLYAESQVRAHADLLCRGVLGNPHSRNPSSQLSTQLVEDAREHVREFFEADPAEYEVIFTLNASGALKLVGESFPFGPGSRFVLTADNHNSVNGIREFALARGAEVRYVPIGPELRVRGLETHLEGADPDRPNLFVYPAQSNFSGVKHPLEWIETVRTLGYHVLLDSAAFVPTSPFSLRTCKPDFACLSFYKMFGFPTGVGALLARRDALGRLHRPWFCGGTVRFVAAQAKVQIPHTTARGFEDGTLNFLDIAAVPVGLNFLRGIGMERVQRHVMALTGVLLREFVALRHDNGAPLVRVYGPQTTKGRGATVAFNVLDREGQMVDFRLVEQRASEANISLRTGYFCNPGAAEFALEHPDDEVYRCFKTIPPESFTIQQFSVCLHDKPVGAVRVSFGVASNEADLHRLLDVLRSFRDAATPSGAPAVVSATGG